MLQKEIMRFWTWFIQHEHEFYAINEHNFEKILTLINDKIVAIDPDLAIEFQFGLENEKRIMTISADGIHDAFPAVIETVKKAPVLSRWKFVAFRQRIGTDIVLDFDDVKLTCDNIFFEHEETEDHKIGIVVYAQDFDEDMVNPLYILLDSILGEYDVETKLSFVEFDDIENLGHREAHPLKKLPQIVDNHFK